MSRANGHTTQNGTNGRSKRTSSTQADAATAGAPFIVPAAEPIDACMWPLQPALWFQPERPPVAPSWSGLGIERQNRIPAPGFRRGEVAALNRAVAHVMPVAAALPRQRPATPESDLATFGWDPRTVYRKEEGQ